MLDGGRHCPLGQGKRLLFLWCFVIYGPSRNGLGSLVGVGGVGAFGDTPFMRFFDDDDVTRLPY